MLFDESELKELGSIRSSINNRLIAVQGNPIMILYLNIIYKDSKVTRGMLYSFDDNYLFMDKLERKLGCWYRPGGGVRYLSPRTSLYILIEDDFNFYAAVQSIISDRYSGPNSMELFINGAELKK